MDILVAGVQAQTGLAINSRIKPFASTEKGDSSEIGSVGLLCRSFSRIVTDLLVTGLPH
jgi:hypothetical protein